MLGSEVVNKHVYYALKDAAAIQAVIGNPVRMTADQSRHPTKACCPTCCITPRMRLTAKARL
jgi:hypothetical protein